METESTHIHSLIKTHKKAWGQCLCAFFRLNIPQINLCDVTEDGNLIINGKVYKLDVSDYTGSEERYVFFNPQNGRIFIESNNIKKIYKFEVKLFDEDDIRGED